MNEYETTVRALTALAADGADDGLVVMVVNDLARALTAPSVPGLAEIEAALAAAREHADAAAGFATSPLETLRSGKATDFKAGALWACSDIVRAYRRQLASERERRSQRLGRDSARKCALELLRTQSEISPSEVRSALAARGVAVTADTVSKALADLFEDGVLTPAPSRPGANRRQRFYGLTSGDGASDPKLDEVRALIQEARARVPEDELRQAFAQGMDERA